MEHFIIKSEFVYRVVARDEQDAKRIAKEVLDKLIIVPTIKNSEIRKDDR